jgi:tripartite-type tricarboxylate transporter receptor subunit TctC
VGLKRRGLLLGAVFALSAMTATAQTADFPKKPVTIVVPFAAGGPSDTITRVVAEAMGRDFGQRVLVQNYGGAGGTVGSNRVVQAAPDGYMLLMHHTGLATAKALYKNLPFDPQKDLAPIGMVSDGPMAITARKGFPPNTLKELIAYLQQQQNKVSYASAGIGGASFLCGLLLGQRIGVNFNQIAYTGTGPAYTDYIAGRVDMLCDLTTGTAPLIKSGDIKGYALTAEQRAPVLPDLPTATEAGLPHFDVSVWYGLYAPAKTPAPIIDRINKALRAALLDKGVSEKLASTGSIVAPPDQVTPDALRAKLKQQIEQWTPIIAKSGVSVE